MTRWTPLLLALCGCAPTVCDYAGEWADRCKVEWTEADDQTCTDRLKGCTRAEREQLEAFWFCMEKQGFFQCDGGGDTGIGADPDAAAALLACQPELKQVPVSCSSAIGIAGGTFAGLEPTATTTAR